MGAGVDPEDEDYTPLVPQVRVRVLVECNTVEQFVAEYHRFVDGDRIFIATEVSEAVGNLVQFRVDLGDGRAVLHGTGTVLSVRPPHDGLPRGMVLQFIALDENSVRIVELMARQRARLTPAEGVLSMEAPPAGSDEAVARVATPVPEEPNVLDSQSETRTYPRVDSTAPFRLRAGAPDARRTWRTRSVERDGVLPANPFSDVPDVALAYFVDWAIERNGTASPAGARAVAFADVQMAAPRRRRRRPPTWVPFVVGIGLGGVAIVAAFDVWRDVAAVAPPAAREVATREAAKLEVAKREVAKREVLTFPPVVAHDVPAPVRPERPAPAAAAPVAAPAAAAPVAAPHAAPVAAPRAAPVATPSVSPKSAELVPLAIAADPGAQIILDGQRVGHTPLVLKVPKGAHAVELQRPRYQTAHLDVDAPGRAVAHLERPRATLHVTSNVADAEVFVDGESVGRAPLSAQVSGYERCVVEVRAGQRTWKKKVYVKPPLTDLVATF
jgi:hypothetical protein